MEQETTHTVPIRYPSGIHVMVQMTDREYGIFKELLAKGSKAQQAMSMMLTITKQRNEE